MGGGTDRASAMAELHRHKEQVTAGSIHVFKTKDERQKTISAVFRLSSFVKPGSDV